MNPHSSLRPLYKPTGLYVPVRVSFEAIFLRCYYKDEVNKYLGTNYAFAVSISAPLIFRESSNPKWPFLTGQF